MAKSQKQNALLDELLRTSGTATHDGDLVDPLSEPYPTLPLWRRVDRQFWWNESLSRHFVNAGVIYLDLACI